MTNKGERKGMERVREGNNYTLGKDLVGHHITENQETVITQQMLLYSFKIRTCQSVRKGVIRYSSMNLIICRTGQNGEGRVLNDKKMI